jgi:hypothetical protein
VPRNYAAQASASRSRVMTYAAINHTVPTFE